jgi:hypothetical protein
MNDSRAIRIGVAILVLLAGLWVASQGIGRGF